MKQNTVKKLTPRQSAYLRAYSDALSPSFANSYKSALAAGYSVQTARNMAHLNPDWRSDFIGQMVSIEPKKLMQALTDIIQSDSEPTIVKLRAIELAMKAHNMLSQRKEATKNVVNLNIDLGANKL